MNPLIRRDMRITGPAFNESRALVMVVSSTSFMRNGFYVFYSGLPVSAACPR
jgi:hypothetical protein